jgi:hypothetical protein
MSVAASTPSTAARRAASPSPKTTSASAVDRVPKNLLWCVAGRESSSAATGCWKATRRVASFRRGGCRRRVNVGGGDGVAVNPRPPTTAI